MARQKAISVNIESLAPWLEPILPGTSLEGKAVLWMWSTPAKSTTMQWESQESYELAQLHKGIYTKRDSLLSIAYSEELISATISATLQSTDRHHGVVGQKRCHFQGDS